MTANPSASDWSAKRGERWLANLAGMEAMLAPIDEPLIRALRLDRPYRIADVGCGGGSTALAIHARAPKGSLVHGFDISPSLVDHARSRIPPGDGATAFTVADATTATVDAPYDRLVSRFGVMFFADPDAAFANLARWLDPRGRFAFAVWHDPAENPWMSSVREVVERIVAVPPTDPEGPGAFRYAFSNRLLGVLDRTGFDDLEVHDWRGSIPIGGGLPPTDAARFALAAFANFGDLLAAAGEAAMARAQQDLTQLFADHQRDGRVMMDAAVHIVIGRRS